MSLTSPESSENPISDELTLHIARMLKSGINNLQTANPNPDRVMLSIKMNGKNYPLWARLMRVEIGVQGRTGHITGGTSALAANDHDFLRWEQEDLRVFSWILQNIETNLMNSVSEYQSAKALWDTLAVTYDSGVDALQIYDLHN